MCARECQHPLWGGGGICLEETEYSPAVCSCDAGFASRDALGHASCVPKRVLVTGHAVLVVASVLTAALFVRDINQYRHLPSLCRNSKKAVKRMRTLVFFTIYVLGFGCIGLALALRAGDTGYLDKGVIQVSYILLLPSIMFAVAMISESWVASLPSQLVTPKSFAGMLRNAADEHDIFLKIGIVNAGTISSFGVLTFIHPVFAVLLADIAISVGAVITVITIVFVSTRITGVINEAISKGSTSPTALEFYTKAKKNLLVQAVGLCAAGVSVIAVIATEHLTLAGRTTPTILYNLQILTGHVAGMVVSLATRFEAQAQTQTTAVGSPGGTGISRVASVSRVAEIFSQGGAAALALLPFKLPNVRPDEEGMDDDSVEKSDNDHDTKFCSIRTNATVSERPAPKEKAFDRQHGVAKSNTVLPTHG